MTLENLMYKCGNFMYYLIAVRLLFYHRCFIIRYVRVFCLYINMPSKRSKPLVMLMLEYYLPVWLSGILRLVSMASSVRQCALMMLLVCLLIAQYGFRIISIPVRTVSVSRCHIWCYTNTINTACWFISIMNMPLGLFVAKCLFLCYCRCSTLSSVPVAKDWLPA